MLSTPNPVQAPPADIRHLWHALFGCLRSVKAEARFQPLHGLSPMETETLDQVAEHPDLLLRELAATLRIPPSTLTSLVNRLERQGLLARTISARDRRSYGLALTDQGRQAQEAHREFETVAWARIMRPLGDLEQAAFLDMLGTMVQGFHETPKGQPHA
jgi:DNA-binding MarR family transcriptional regulator